MRDKSTRPVISPDGRFEVIIEEDYDRGIFYLQHAPLKTKLLAGIEDA